MWGYLLLSLSAGLYGSSLLLSSSPAAEQLALQSGGRRLPIFLIRSKSNGIAGLF